MLLIHQMYQYFLIGMVWFDDFDLLQIHIHLNVTRCQTGIRLNQIKRICNSLWNKNSQLKLIRFFFFSSEYTQNRQTEINHCCLCWPDSSMVMALKWRICVLYSGFRYINICVILDLPFVSFFLSVLSLLYCKIWEILNPSMNSYLW